MASGVLRIKLDRPKKRPLMISSSYARWPQVPIALCRIAAIRPNGPMLSGARGGLGGTRGWRPAGMSQVSATLTGNLSQQEEASILAAHHAGLPNAAREGAASRQLIGELGHRNPVFGGRPRTCDDPFLVEQRRHRTTGLRRGQPQCAGGVTGDARLYIRGLLAVEHHDIARQPEITARPAHQDDAACSGIRGNEWTRGAKMHDVGGAGER